MSNLVPWLVRFAKVRNYLQKLVFELRICEPDIAEEGHQRQKFGLLADIGVWDEEVEQRSEPTFQSVLPHHSIGLFVGVPRS